ncbi:MAG TPA: hypothetical protein VF525_16855 [Pyrinomonadaceae bacterium]
MQRERQVRIIKRSQSEGTAQTATERRPVNAEREMRATVNGWIQEHRQRSSELRRSLTVVFGASGNQPCAPLNNGRLTPGSSFAQLATAHATPA